MSTTPLPSHAELASQLLRDSIGVDASELHGVLCGYIAGGGKPSGHDWLANLAVDAPTPLEGSALTQMQLGSLAQFAGDDYGLTLLLPPDDAPLGIRADCVLQWCRGFLGGFGLAGHLDALPDNVSEAINDLHRIGSADVSVEDEEADEEALAEIIEFVRMAALMIHQEMASHEPTSDAMH